MTQDKPGNATGEFGGTKKPNLRKKPSLRRWLPGIHHSDSLSSTSFLLVLIAGVFTALFLFTDDALLSKAGSVVSSAFFGLMLSNWWSEFSKGDAKRREAIELDDRVEEEIQRISEHWKQAIQSLKSLMNDDPHPEFVKASRYFIGLQMNLVIGRLERAALRMDQLGFNSEDFLAEKKERLTKVKRGAAEIVTTMPADTNTDLLLRLFVDAETLNEQGDTNSIVAQRKIGSSHEPADDGSP